MNPLLPKLEFPNDKKQIFLQNLLKDYLNNEWEVLDIPEAKAMGIIPMRNISTHTVNLLSITIHPMFEPSGIDKLSFGNVDTIKSMIFLNSFKDQLLKGGFSLGEIITFNLEKQKYHRELNFRAFDLYEKRMIQSNMNHTNKLSKSGDLKSIDSIVMNLLRSSLNNYSGDDKNAVEALFNAQGGFDWVNADYGQLKLVQDAFLKEYPKLKDRTLTPTMDFSNKEEYLYAMLQMAINIKLGFLPEGDFYNMSNLGVYFSDFKSLLGAIYSKEEPEFNKDEKRIMGLLQGLNFVTPD